MANYQIDRFAGNQCWKMSNQLLSLWLSADFGPRVLGLSYRGGENLLAVLPDARLEAAPGRVYSLRGGHRLWYGPERPQTTYIPDDQAPQVSEKGEGLEFIQEVDQPTGIQKSWHISLDPASARVEIDHRLENCGTAAFDLAPWAVTMLRPGGVGLLPFQVEQDDENGLWPNRQLALWPYTDIRSRYVDIYDQAVFVTAKLKEGALKIGAPNPLGYLAYRQNELLFVKQSHYQRGKEYLDRGASHQIYCSPDVIELETLGPLTSLEPGQFVNHVEIWQVYSKGSWPENIKELFDLIDS